MDIYTIKECPLCGSTRHQPVVVCKDHYVTGEEFTIYACEDCGFRFTQDVPAENSIGRYYDTPDYISHSDTQKGLMNRVYHWARKYMMGRKARLVIKASRMNGGKLLDVGAGTGYFAHDMYLRGWNVVGIERHERARRACKELFDIELRATDYLSNLKNESFDVITMWHVLEHVQHVNEELDLLHRLLVDGGCLVLALPNCSSVDEQIYKENWAAYDVPRHLWHFTPETIERMARKHQFRLIQKKAMPLDAFYISMLSEKYQNRKHPFVNGLFQGVRCWASAGGNPDRSSSVVYVFKKL